LLANGVFELLCQSIAIALAPGELASQVTPALSSLWFLMALADWPST
jgi:hypothetical protein